MLPYKYKRLDLNVVFFSNYLYNDLFLPSQDLTASGWTRWAQDNIIILHNVRQAEA